MNFGGIDLGGTKIEARLFDADMQEIARHRIATPVESYEAMTAGIISQIQWLEAQGNVTTIGLGSPGLCNPMTGKMLTANLPATGQALGTDLSAQAGRPVHMVNDCRAFTLSEATMGAGQGVRNVVGLVLGTGVAGGHTIDGQLIPDFNGQHGEYGHLPLPADWSVKHRVPVLPCGCGLMGCFETYLSGPGLTRLAAQMTGKQASTHSIMSDAAFEPVRATWADLAAALVGMITRTADPEVIVLGGGLGMVDGLPGAITQALRGKLLANTTPPRVVQARHDDASGALGAAIFARYAEVQR